MLKLFEYLNGIQYFYYARYFTTNVSNNLLSVTGFSVVHSGNFCSALNHGEDGDIGNMHFESMGNGFQRKFSSHF